jgi:hypothetical protein
MSHSSKNALRTILPVKRKQIAELFAEPAEVPPKRQTIAQACDTCRKVKRKVRMPLFMHYHPQVRL